VFGGVNDNNNQFVSLNTIEFLKSGEAWFPGTQTNASATLCTAEYGFGYVLISP
jgi:hypothetical protein